MHNQLKDRKTGFTLIELLVVIAIIGILSSVVLASLNSARKKSRDARRVADIGQLRLALELYFDANRDYPLTLSSLAPTYIPVVPTDPLTAAYTFEKCSSTLYHMGSALEENTHAALGGDLEGNVSGCSGTWGVDSAVCSGTAGVNQGSYCYDLTN